MLLICLFIYFERFARTENGLCVDRRRGGLGRRPIRTVVEVVVETTGSEAAYLARFSQRVVGGGGEFLMMRKGLFSYRGYRGKCRPHNESGYG